MRSTNFAKSTDKRSLIAAISLEELLICILIHYLPRKAENDRRHVAIRK